MQRTSSLAVLLAAALVSGCEGGWFGADTEQPIPGERLSVMIQDRAIEPDPALADLPVRLPVPIENAAWPQPGGTPSHAMEHLAGETDDGLTIVWRTGIGAGTSRSGRIASPPVVAEGRVYVMDAGTQLTAVDAASGRTVWTFDVQPEEEGDGGVGGGVAFDQGRLYVTTGYAQVIALDADGAKELWRQTLTAPMRAGPTVGGGRVFATTVDNQIHALDAATGRRLWTHSGISETAGFYGGASPALEGNITVAAFSSGELFALRVDNGRVLWSDSLAGALRADPVSSLADIRGLPVIDRGQVIAASNADRIVSIDLRSGGRIWDQNIGSLYTPWVAGAFVFATSVDNVVVCLSRRDGRVRWATQLKQFRDEKARRGRIVWTGPVLVGSRLFLASSEGNGILISPLTGEITSHVQLPGPVFVAPVVANRTVYVVTDGADLVALR
ncbi:MAG TPA: PQQ-binding-like beta-propeller repeat protein [Alphaproteobacteria bacterium]